jgi:ribonuclease HI
MSESKKHFYAVLKGRESGIFSRWTGSGGAEEQVKGFPGAKFRGFSTQEEAEYYLHNGGKLLPSQPMLASLPAAANLRYETAVAPGSGAPAARRTAPEHAADLAAGKTVIFTDGASTGNPGPGGYGVVILNGESRQEFSGGYQCTTNNRMELMGVIVALQSISPHSQVVLYSDSRYVINAVELGWAKRWQARNWMRDATHPAENADLWARLLGLLNQQSVEFRWVKGHASHPENERCDRLAVQAAHQRGLPVDDGFRQRC